MNEIYQTDRARKDAGRRPCATAPELDLACKSYFDLCDSQEPPRHPTFPGLLLYLGVTPKTWRAWADGEKGYTKFSPICQKALLEIRDRLEQRKDAAAIFLLKQKNYGGYSDRPETDCGGGVKITVTFGHPPPHREKGKNPS